MTHQRDVWSWAGIWLVGLTAIAWSFAALTDLAELVHISDVLTLSVFAWAVTIRIAWGLPITVDVLAVVATRVWLRGTAPADAVRFAQRAAWAAIGTSVAGNVYHGVLTGQGRLDTAVVSAVPPAIIGTLVHLAVLVGRPQSPGAGDAARQAGEPGDDRESAEPVPNMPADIPGDLSPASPTEPGERETQPGEPGEERESDRASELIAAGVGRRKLARELEISEYEARRLLEGAGRNGDGETDD